MKWSRKFPIENREFIGKNSPCNTNIGGSKKQLHTY